MKGVVLGEIGMDMLIRAIPAPPTVSTLRGSDFVLTPGGRGANQAVAVARLGVETHLVGRVGSDDFGDQLIRRLGGQGVVMDAVFRDDGSTCVMVLGIDDDGDYFPVAKVLGANARVGEDDLVRFRTLLAGSDFALLQFGVPFDIVVAAAQAARQRGVTTILDPTPVPQSLPPELAAAIDVITPNTREVRLLTGVEIADMGDAAEAATHFHAWGFATVIIKLGERGAFVSSHGVQFHVPTFSVIPVDTVGAGDAFNAALAVALARGMSLHGAATWGAAAGALTLTKAGAQDALPTLTALQSFLAQNMETIPE